MSGLQEDNKSLKLSVSKVETERKQAQERSNNLEKVYTHPSSICECMYFHAVESEAFLCISN